MTRKPACRECREPVKGETTHRGFFMTQQGTESESCDHIFLPEEQVYAGQRLLESILACYGAGMDTLAIRAVFVKAVRKRYLGASGEGAVKPHTGGIFMTQQGTESESCDHIFLPEEQVYAGQRLPESILACYGAGMDTLAIRAVFVKAVRKRYLPDSGEGAAS